MAAIDNYPTRCGGEPAISRRLEPVLWQNWHAGAPLTPLHCRQWRERGFIVLHDLLTAGEVDLLHREATRLRDDPAVRSSNTAITESSNGELRSLFRPQQHGMHTAALLQDRRLIEIAEFLLASKVYLHQARINYKPAFRGAGFYWHSDFETWHAEDGLPAMRTLSVSVLLTDNTAANGPLLLIPGSHRWFVSCPAPTPANHFRRSLKEQRIGIPDDSMITALATDGIDAVTGPAGTVVIFDCNLLHGSPENISPQPRSNLFFVYNSVHNRPERPFCGRPPRPDYVAERRRCAPLQPAPG